MSDNFPTHGLPRIAILGGGITGLTAAWHLRRAGCLPVVFEKSLRPGGAIGAVRHGDWLHELGPNSMLEGSTEIARFIEELGLGGRRLYASPAAKRRYIVRGGRLLAMPASPLGFVATRLFSWRAKLGLLGEPWRPPGPPDADESVADFVVRRLGREFLDYAVNPFVGGVYAGDPRRLSVRYGFPKLQAIEQQHGSLIRGALKRRNTSGGPAGRMFSFPEGLGEVPAAIAQALGNDLRLGHRVTSLRRENDRWTVGYESVLDRGQAEFDAVICALPADALAQLAIADLPAAASPAVLGEIEHPPVASVFLGYARQDIAHPLDGFGALVPEVERRLLLGVLFSSTLFAGRAPAGHVALTAFVGGTRQPELARMSGEELLRVTHAELSQLLGIRGEPVFTRVQSWPRAIPQYTLGYNRFLDAIARVESAAPGLFIGGNCRDGISLANCIAAGKRLAEAAENFLKVMPFPHEAVSV